MYHGAIVASYRVYSGLLKHRAHLSSCSVEGFRVVEIYASSRVGWYKVSSITIIVVGS